MANVRIYDDVDQLAAAAAEDIIQTADIAIANRSFCNIALAGGSTPRTLYQLLATPEVAARLDWRHIRLFWGDERCVPPDSPDSNYRMAREALLSKVPISTPNIHRMRGEIDPQRAALEYEHMIRDILLAGQPDADTVPAFDIVLLGMGDDGHTASLFPGTRALQEQERLVVANYVTSKGVWRITMTARLINAATRVMFLVVGETKADRLQDVLEGPHQPETLPAQLIRPTDGELLWLVDQAAARKLSSSAG